MSVDMEKLRREQIRWVLLLALNHARPYGTAEVVLLGAVQGVYQDATALEIRRELDYLEARRLVELAKAPSGPWHAELTGLGVDVAEYTVDVHPGIARPQKYW